MVRSMADQTQGDPAADLYGRVIALEAIVTRLLASHAQMHPRGVAARMLADIDGVVNNVKSRLPEGAEALRIADGAASAPLPEPGEGPSGW